MPYSEHSDDQKYEVDVEKAAQHCDITGSTAVILAVDDGVNRESGVFGRMWKVIVWANAFGVEARGIERVPEEERTHEGIYDSGFLWLSASMTVATLRTLGSSIWYMGLTDALLTIVFFNLLTTIPVAIFATWGMRTGLRQMVLVRHHWCLFPRPPQLYCMPRVVRHQYHCRSVCLTCHSRLGSNSASCRDSHNRDPHSWCRIVWIQNCAQV